MSDFLSRLAERALGFGSGVRPVIPSRFDPARELESVAAAPWPAPQDDGAADADLAAQSRAADTSIGHGDSSAGRPLGDEPSDNEPPADRMLVPRHTAVGDEQRIDAAPPARSPRRGARRSAPASATDNEQLAAGVAPPVAGRSPAATEPRVAGRSRASTGRGAAEQPRALTRATARAEQEAPADTRMQTPAPQKAIAAREETGDVPLRTDETRRRGAKSESGHAPTSSPAKASPIRQVTSSTKRSSQSLQSSQSSQSLRSLQSSRSPLSSAGDVLTGRNPAAGTAPHAGVGPESPLPATAPDGGPIARASRAVPNAAEEPLLVRLPASGRGAHSSAANRAAAARPASALPFAGSELAPPVIAKRGGRESGHGGRADDATPIVRITIGRVEVRAASPAAPSRPTRTTPAERPAQTLDHYLGRPAR